MRRCHARGARLVKPPKDPRFSDDHRFKRPYVDAEATKKEGYLAARFKKIRAEAAEKERAAQAEAARIAAEQAAQEARDEAERAEKVRRMARK